MQASPQPPPVWRRSSYSGGGNNCVEVARVGATVAVRDSKSPADPAVAMPLAVWRSLVGRVKSGELDP